MRKVLVTGGAGFIGSHMADRLIDESYDVTVIDNESSGTRSNVKPKARYIRGDVANSDDLDLAFRDGPEVVFHIAGQASVIQSFTAPEHDLWVNVHGTVNVIKKCLEYRVPRLLYASSMAVYGRPRVAPTSESELCIPNSYYGITKYAAERYVHATGERTDLGFKFEVTSFRMFNVYGERQSLTNPYQGVVAIFIGNVLRDEPITIHSDGEQSRDFVHIRDVVEAWMLALDCPDAYGQVFNLGTGISRSINELSDVTFIALGRSREEYPVVYAQERPGDQRTMTADISRARAILGWEPKVQFHQGMAQTIRWAVRNNELHSKT